MPKETMSPRERWEAVLARQLPDRVPMDYWSTPEFNAALMRFTGHTDRREMLQALHVDFVIHAGPSYIGPTLPPNIDVFGVTYRDVDYGTGVYPEAVGHPLAGFSSVAEVEANYTWPDPDWYDYTGIADQIKGWEHYPIQGGGSEPFLIYKDLRGQEQAFIDLVERPDLVHYCLDKLFELAYVRTARTYEQIPGKVMFSYVAEDMGGQEGLMISKRHIREFLLPGMKRMIDLVHSAGAYAFHHNDGNCRAILPDMIELGIDVLNPIQWRSKNMEREGLKSDFGDHLIFHGAMDNQYTLPFGAVDEVRQEVRDNLRILGAGGGFILAPCHNIQPVTPPENVVAMYEEGYARGWV